MYDKEYRIKYEIEMEKSIDLKHCIGSHSFYFKAVR